MFASLFSRIYQVLLVGLAFLLPVIFLPVPWATLAHAKIGLVAICAGLGIAAFALARFFEGQLSFPKSWIVIPSFLLPIVYFASALSQGASRASLLGGGETDTVAVMFLWVAILVLAALSFRTRPELMRVQTLLLWSAAVVAVFHIARLVLGAGVLSLGGLFTDPAASVVGGWHDLGIFLGLMTFFAAAYVTTAPTFAKPLMIWGLRVFVALSVLLLVVINTFDVWLGLSILSAVALVYVAMRSPAEGEAPLSFVGRITKAHLFAVLLAVSVLFVISGTTIHDMLPERIRIAQVEVRPSWEGTFSVATQTFEDSGALFGSGPNTFVRQWGHFKPAGVNETAFWNADFAQGIGFVPTSLVTVGIVGAVVWVLFLLGVLAESMRMLFRAPREVHPQVTMMVLGVLYLWVINIVYPPGATLIALTFLLTGVLVAWGVSIGVIPTYNRAVRDVPQIGFVWSVALIIIAVVALLVSAVVLRASVSDMLVNKGISTYNTTGNIEDSRASIEKALAIDSGNDRAHRAALELGILQIVALAQSSEPDAETLRTQLQETISQSIEHGLAAVSGDSSNYQNWLSLARVYEQLVGAQVEGAYENAQKAYEQAIAENPTNPLFPFRLAQLAVARGDVVAAEQYLTQALTLKPNFAAALFLASQVSVSKNDLQTALLMARAAAQAAPQEPVAWFQLGGLLVQAGDAQNAALALEQAVVLNGNYANALYLLSLSYNQIGKKEEAIRAMERVLELNPGNEQVVGIIEELKNPAAAVDEESTEE